MVGSVGAGDLAEVGDVVVVSIGPCHISVGAKVEETDDSWLKVRPVDLDVCRRNALGTRARWVLRRHVLSVRERVTAP
jgi:hypothetical protein